MSVIGRLGLATGMSRKVAVKCLTLADRGTNLRDAEDIATIGASLGGDLFTYTGSKRLEAEAEAPKIEYKWYGC